MRSIFRNIKSLLLFPLAILPIGMLCYAVGTLLQTQALIGTTFFVDHLNFIPRILRLIGYTLQTQTGLIVAITISLGLSNKSIRAALSTIVVYMFMQVSFDVLMSIFLSKDVYQEFANMPVTIYPFYLIGGIIIAAVVSRFHVSHEQKALLEKLENIKQKGYQSFLAILTGMLVSIVLSIAWCYVMQGLMLIVPYINGLFGASIYGFFETLLRPIGITTLYETMQNFTYIGSTWRIPSPINTNTVGFESIWLNQLQYNSANFTVGTTTASRYISGMFITPAIGLALINASYVEHRKNVRTILLTFMIISAVVGFTLPIEIILLFSSPILFVINAILNGLVSGVIHFLSGFININLITFSGGGLFDFIFFGIMPGVEKTGAWALLLIGLVNAVVSYFLFYWVIKQFNLPVFGRNKNELEIFTSYIFNDNQVESTEATLDNKMRTVIYALGGKDNIEQIDVSMYRLHIAVKKVDLIEKLPIKESGAAGIFVVGSTVQVIFGAVTQEYYKVLMKELEE